MVETTQKFRNALARLAFSTADYESAWRESTSEISDKNKASRMMCEATEEQVQARADLIAMGLSENLVASIYGALVMAAARPTGTRPERHRGTDASIATVSNMEEFIFSCQWEEEAG